MGSADGTAALAAARAAMEDEERGASTERAVGARAAPPEEGESLMTAANRHAAGRKPGACSPSVKKGSMPAQPAFAGATAGEGGAADRAGLPAGGASKLGDAPAGSVNCSSSSHALGLATLKAQQEREPKGARWNKAGKKAAATDWAI